MPVSLVPGTSRPSQTQTESFINEGLAWPGSIYQTTISNPGDDSQCTRPYWRLTDNQLTQKQWHSGGGGLLSRHLSYLITLDHKSTLISLWNFNLTFNGPETADKQILCPAPGQDLSSLSRCLQFCGPRHSAHSEIFFSSCLVKYFWCLEMTKFLWYFEEVMNYIWYFPACDALLSAGFRVPGPSRQM